jgi:DNA mismatch repair protein MutL
MSSIIQLLPDHVANQIAAGEVVQRPASVVKELIENAVDARSSHIKLIIKESGKTLIQLVDNGIGMNVTDARMCFERHATSKIKNAEDLFALDTKGFRGEALASIAAVAHVEVKTKQEQEELGTHIIIEGSKIVTQEPIVTPKGTSFLVKNLFFNIPARRNFLKSDTIEFKHILDEFLRVALPHFNIHFTMLHNGSEVFDLPKSTLKQRIVNIFGGKTNDKLVPVEEETDLVKISGFVAKAEYSKKTKNEQYFFVNNRFIRSPYLHHAVMSAYEGLLVDGLQPSYFLFIDVPPHTIDINIHPTKTEIKFDNEQVLYAVLRSCIRHSLGMFQVKPTLDFDSNPELELNYAQAKSKESEFPTVTIDTFYNPFEVQKETSTKSTSNNYNSNVVTKSASSWESLYVGLKADVSDIFEQVESKKPEFSSFIDQNTTERKSVCFQLFNKYVASPMKNSLILIHQNRAHQRILYERFLTVLTFQKGSSQKLLFPLELEFNVIEFQTLLNLKESLEFSGFIFDEMEHQRIVISGLPLFIQDKEVTRVFEKIILDFQDNIPNNSFSQNDLLAKSMAKSLAIKTGQALTLEFQEDLINQLFACKDAQSSPFEKNIITQISLEEIETKF